MPKLHKLISVKDYSDFGKLLRVTAYVLRFVSKEPLVRDIYSNSKTMHKCYISLFSCCVTRMLHLELQPNVEAISTIRSMRRTFARVGTPALLISDNHKTYRAKKTQDFALKHNIKWRNILNLAPNWGGFYERMNSTIKNALRKTLKNAHLDYEELETIVIEIESVMNSRPLMWTTTSYSNHLLLRI